MIGSHNSLTYAAPLNPLMYLFKQWWKCECRSIQYQYDFGVRFFDIRVVYYNGKWYGAHGLATLKVHFDHIKDICNYMSTTCPDAIYRIVLERGNDDIQALFRMASQDLCKEYPNCWRIDIKSTQNWKGNVANNNDNLYKRGYEFALVNTWELPSHQLHAQVTKDNWYKINIRKEAKKTNSQLQFYKNDGQFIDMCDNKKELYFLDYPTEKK